jgi:hypothetical protein
MKEEERYSRGDSSHTGNGYEALVVLREPSSSLSMNQETAG